MRRVLLDTNVYIDWMNRGDHEAVVLGPGFVRHLSSVVLLELEVGATSLAARRAVKQIATAFDKAGRIAPPSPAAWRRAGPVLRTLRARGRETRRASLVHDVMIALTARELGAAVVTSEASDYAAIQPLVEVPVMVV
jgi:predicted nucleic acid-binding protein